MHGRVRLIGIDCATEDARVGLALGAFDAGRLRVERAVMCTKSVSASATIAGWLEPVEGPTLLAVDAPLGWPAPLAQALAEHRAGDEITVAPNTMFRRETDRFIQRELRKTPLDVGADRIARTAHAALRLLGDLRRRTGLAIPLAWGAELGAPLSAIEVYPAATLTSHGFRASGYKASHQTAERDAIIANLRTVAELPPEVSTLRANADALDAAVCLLAGADFLRGSAMPPVDLGLAEREGWIWVKGR